MNVFNKKLTPAATIWAEKFDWNRCVFYLQDYTGFIKQIPQTEFNYLYDLETNQNIPIKEKTNSITQMYDLMKVVDS